MLYNPGEYLVAKREPSGWKSSWLKNLRRLQEGNGQGLDDVADYQRRLSIHFSFEKEE